MLDFPSNTLGAFLVTGSARTHISTSPPPTPPQVNADTLLAKKKEFSHFSLLIRQNHHIYMPTQIETREGGHTKRGGGELFSD